MNAFESRTVRVVAVACSATHSFSKPLHSSINLIQAMGVEGDAHSGSTVKHRSRVARDPSQPNLRQVHLLHSELFDELRQRGFDLAPGDLGENITTQGIDLLGLPTGAQLKLGPSAVVEITGLRNPCSQIDAFKKGLLAAVLDRNETRELVRKAGVMGVILASGEVRPGDAIQLVLPELPHRRLKPV